jgi:hypothetical protein
MKIESIVRSAKMAATANGNGNLVDEFEEAFQVLLLLESFVLIINHLY